MNIVSIVLLSRNGKRFNKECIDSVLRQSYKDFEIIFVDQCSTDGSLEEVENLHKKEIKNGKIKIVKNTEINGFTGGNNLGVKNIDNNSKYICLLSNDLVVQENLLEELVKGMECDSELGAVSCVVLNKGFEEKERHQIFMKHKKCVSTIFGEGVSKNMIDSEIISNFYYTTNLPGCCFMYKRDLVEEPFPQYYFAYAEDLYLSRLIICMGYKLGVCLNTYINHYGSGTFGKKPSELKLFYGNRNQIINYLVFYPLFYRILLFPLFLIKEIAHLFMGAPLMRFKAKIKGIIWIFNNYDKIRETRGLINKNRKIGYYDFIKKQRFLLSDPVVENKILKILIYIGNLVFLIYGTLITLIFFVIKFFGERNYNLNVFDINNEGK